MHASIHQHVDVAVLVAGHDRRLRSDRQRLEVSRRRDLTFVADENPVALENALHFVVKNFVLEIYSSIDPRDLHQFLELEFRWHDALSGRVRHLLPERLARSQLCAVTCDLQPCGQKTEFDAATRFNAEPTRNHASWFAPKECRSNIGSTEPSACLRRALIGVPGASPARPTMLNRSSSRTRP